MPNISEYKAGNFVKMIYMGNSGAGKTGSLTSLVKAGYKLRILDLDNLLSVLIAYCKRDCPDKLSNIEFETCRDKYKATNIGAVVDGVPKAYVRSLQIMTKWPSDGTSPSEWGEDHIFVIDSFTRLSQCAFEWAKGMNPGAKDPRQWFYQAQQACEQVLSLLTNEGFRSNVIVICHVDYQERQDGTTEGFVKSIGKALGPTVPTYFNTVVLAQSSGSGENVKRTITTVPTNMVSLKNPVPFRLDKSLPLDTGLATLFEKLKEGQ